VEEKIMENSDLHSHSYYSDGIFSPAEVVRKAKEMGVKNLALTDHNSLEGIPKAQKEAKKQGINLIPAVELRSKEGEVLGYFIDFKDKEFIQKVKTIQNRSREVFENTLKELSKKGIIVKSSEVLNSRLKKKNVLTVYIFKFLKERGILDINEIKEIKKAIFKGDLFEAHFSTEEVIKIIIDAGGVAVLAHPWYSKTFLDEIRLKELIASGLKGLEIDNGGRGEKRESSLERIKNFAEKYNLILTSGSDFHGDSSLMSDEHKIGANNCDEEIVERLNLAREKK
jgi:3',5'-nucleoside bisphosphate phosphatase